MNRFYFPFCGNKSRELEIIRKYFDPIQPTITTVVECFGGSLALSRSIHKNYPNLEFIISDADENLIYFCNHVIEDAEIVIDNARNILKTLKTKEDFTNYLKPYRTVEDPDFLSWFLIYRTFNYIRPGVYPKNKKVPTYNQLSKNIKELNSFFAQNEYLCADYMVILETYKNDDQAFVFLDPPYYNSCNELYKHSEVDFEWIKNWCNSCKCKFIMVLNNDPKMLDMFHNFLRETYQVSYKITKKNFKHTLFSNFKI